VGSSPDKAGTAQYCQMGWVRQARSKGVTRVNQCLNPLKRGNRLQPGGYGPGSSARHLLRVWVATPKPTTDVGGEAVGEYLRCTHGEAAAAKLDADPINRDMVNVGTVSGSPYSSCCLHEDGQAHRQLMTPRRGGGSVVVRGRESRSHGEGTQRVRSRSSGMPGGRR